MVVTRGMKKHVGQTELLESTPLIKTINHVPSEVHEMILKKLDSGENSLLPYRLVNSEWKNTIDGILEKQALKGDLVTCSTAVIVNAKGHPVPKIRCPHKIFRHSGNPFPSRSLLVTKNNYDQKNYGRNSIVQPLDIFTTKFGSHLNTLVLDRVHFRIPALIQILRPLINLRILKLSKTTVYLKLEDDLESFPTLLLLTTLELNFIKFNKRGNGSDRDTMFFTKFIASYAPQLVSLRLEEELNDRPLQDLRPLVDKPPFQNLQQLKVFNPTVNFFRLSCVPPIKHLSIVGVFCLLVGVRFNDLMSFVDKFSNTLESLVLDVYWKILIGISYNHQGLLETGTTSQVILPKLTKFSIQYPTNMLELVSLTTTFLVKFPALTEFHLLQFKICQVINESGEQGFSNGLHRDPERRDEDIHVIMAASFGRNYPRVSSSLKRVSVWFTGEKNSYRPTALYEHEDNYLVYYKDTNNV